VAGFDPRGDSDISIAPGKTFRPAKLKLSFGPRSILAF
jgi:hypothetical protein